MSEIGTNAKYCDVRYAAGIGVRADSSWTSRHGQFRHKPDVRDVAMLAGGMSRTDILKDYPYLENADIDAALAFAARQTDHPVIAAE
jgi:hypothetical protein